MALHTIIIYAATLVLIRIGSKRFLGQATAFDMIVGIMLGSVMGRAINSSAPLFPTLLTGAVFVGLHRLLNVLAFRTGWFVRLHHKGQPCAVDQGREDSAAGQVWSVFPMSLDAPTGTYTRPCSSRP